MPRAKKHLHLQQIKFINGCRLKVKIIFTLYLEISIQCAGDNTCNCWLVIVYCLDLQLWNQPGFLSQWLSQMLTQQADLRVFVTAVSLRHLAHARHLSHRQTPSYQISFTPSGQMKSKGRLNQSTQRETALHATLLRWNRTKSDTHKYCKLAGATDGKCVPVWPTERPVWALAGQVSSCLAGIQLNLGKAVWTMGREVYREKHAQTSDKTINRQIFKLMPKVRSQRKDIWQDCL